MINTNTLEISNELLILLSEIDEFKGSWIALNKINPDRLNTLRHIATIESIGSSTRIEGSQLSDREVEQLLGKLKIRQFESRDEQEVAGYAEVMETIFNSAKEIPISENYIKQLHQNLLRYSHKDERHRGEYKTLRNDVGAFDSQGKMIGVVFETATPFETPQRMRELLEWFHKSQKENRKEKKLHPLIIISIFIVVFLEIHPFQDGNGRLSRALTTLLMLQAGYNYVPYSSLENIIENNKENYYLALRKTQKTIRSNSPDWQAWLLFFMESLQEQKQRLKKKIEYEHNIISELSKLAIAILEHAKEHGRVTNRDMVKSEGASPNTLKTTLRSLVEKKMLIRHGAGRSTWYSLATI